MDKGTKTYTEFETGDEIVDFLGKNTQYLECKQGMIHSHNNMSTFFSGTDLEEIRDNSANHNYYLSLIVNNKGECCAKIASRGELNETKSRDFTFTGEDGKMKKGKSTITTKDEVVFTYNIDIQLPEGTVDEYFKDRVLEICKPKPVVFKNYSNQYPQGNFDFSYKDRKEEGLPAHRWDFFNGEAIPKTKKVVLEEREKVIATFLNTWMPGAMNTLEDSLDELKVVFRDFGKNEYDVQLDLFTDGMEETLEECYKAFFDDENCLDLNNTLQECADLLNKYTDNNEIADELMVAIAIIKEDRELEKEDIKEMEESWNK